MRFMRTMSIIYVTLFMSMLCHTFYVIYPYSSMVASYAAVVCLLRVVIRTYLLSVFDCI